MRMCLRVLARDGDLLKGKRSVQGLRVMSGRAWLREIIDEQTIGFLRLSLRSFIFLREPRVIETYRSMTHLVQNEIRGRRQFVSR